MRGMKGREMETKKDYQERKERQAREWSQKVEDLGKKTVQARGEMLLRVQVCNLNPNDSQGVLRNFGFNLQN